MSHAHVAVARRRPIALYAVLGAIVLLALVVAVAVGAGESTTATEHETGEVDFEGRELPAYDSQAATDAAVGLEAPRLTGVDFAGEPASVGGSGRPTMVVFLAHWCHVCQAEVPVLSDWLAAGGPPEGVDVVAVPTGTDAAKPNYPPSAWLEREAFEVPVMVDDEQATAAIAYGLPAYPYFVFLNGDGTVSSRAVGQIPVATVDAAIAQLT